MKSKKTKKTVLAFTLLFFSAPAFSQSGGQGGGGGVPASDYILLKDLQGTTCDARTTSTVLKEYNLREKVDQILTALFKAHPYMAYQIRKDMHKLSWCLTTSRLGKINTVDKSSLLLSYDPEVQIAIRDIDRYVVYLDVNYFKKMKPNKLVLGVDKRLEFNQAMLIIHETIHSFLDKNKVDRNDALRTITRSIFSNYVKSTNPIYTIKDQRMDLDAMITMTATQNAFESTRFSLAFHRYLKSRTDRNAAEMAASGLNYDLWFEIMVNDFGHADLISKSPFKNSLFTQKYSGPVVVPTQYNFDDIAITLKKLLLEINERARYTQMFIRVEPADIDTNFMFGSCKVYKKQYLEYYNHIVDIRLAFFPSNTPVFNSNKIEFIPGNRIATKPIEFSFFANVGKDSPVTYDDFYKQPRLKKDILAYNNSLWALLQLINAGLCENKNAPGPKFYY